MTGRQKEGSSANVSSLVRPRDLVSVQRRKEAGKRVAERNEGKGKGKQH